MTTPRIDAMTFFYSKGVYYTTSSITQRTKKYESSDQIFILFSLYHHLHAQLQLFAYSM